PDDAGYLVEGRVGLAMRRLSLIDLATGQQPIHNEDKTLSVVFNGEIYNYRELRAELHAKGHRFSTTSDTEILVHLYEEHREGCVERLRGMFAFAIWDRERQALFLGRDRLGVKPLYYAETPQGCAGRRVPERRRGLERGRRDHGAGSRRARQDLLGRVPRSRLQRASLRALGGGVARDGAPRAAGGAARSRGARGSAGRRGRAVRRRVGDPHLPGVQASPAARQGRAVGGRWRRAVRGL